MGENLKNIIVFKHLCLSSLMCGMDVSLWSNTTPRILCSLFTGSGTPSRVMFGPELTPRFLEKTRQERYVGFSLKHFSSTQRARFLTPNWTWRSQIDTLHDKKYLDVIYIKGILDFRWQCLSRRVHLKYGKNAAQHSTLWHAIFLHMNLLQCKTKSNAKGSLWHTTKMDVQHVARNTDLL